MCVSDVGFKIWVPNVGLKLFALLREALLFESPPELCVTKPGLFLSLSYPLQWGFPGGSVIKNLPTNAGDTGSIPGSGISPGEGNGNLLQHSCPGNFMTEEPGRLQSMGS